VDQDDRLSCAFFGFEPSKHGSTPIWSFYAPSINCAPPSTAFVDSGPIDQRLALLAWVIMSEHRVTVEWGGRIWPGQRVGILRDLPAGSRIILTIRLRRNLENEHFISKP
jgi:hypothetical protein